MVHELFQEIRVADFTWVITGSLTTRYLADHGAQVIRIESSILPDGLRTSPPFKDNVPGIDRSAYFANYNSNKYSIALDLKNPKGLDIAKKLVAWADVVAENFTPGVMNRLGLGYDVMKSIKPDIILYSTCMQGQTGPHSSHPGFGSSLVGLAGITHLTGWPDRELAEPYGAYTDIIAPRFGAAAIAAALDYRRRTGRGVHLDLSQFEATVTFLGPLLLDYQVNQRIAGRSGNRSPQAAPHGVYRCRGNDRWCTIAIFTEDEWLAFCRVIGQPEWTGYAKFATLFGRKANEDELDRLVEEWTEQRQPEEVMALLQAHGVEAGVVHDTQSVHNDEQLEHRHHFWSLDHPDIGMHRYDGMNFRLSKTPGELKTAAPRLGQHTEWVCTHVLGMSDGDFLELLGEGVFR
jgi:benzylsuccinate CoA-transferase BbsF subunit